MACRVGGVVGGNERGGGRGRRQRRYRGRHAMLSAVSAEPKIALEIAIGGVRKETAVHNNRGDSCETRSAQASAAAVSRALCDVVSGVDGAPNCAPNRYRRRRRRNSSPQQSRRQLRDTICSGVGGGDSNFERDVVGGVDGA